jgi:hypothetical protein
MGAVPLSGQRNVNREEEAENMRELYDCAVIVFAAAVTASRTHISGSLSDNSCNG